jgi:CRISPR type III-A-associated protein Csm2
MDDVQPESTQTEVAASEAPAANEAAPTATEAAPAAVEETSAINQEAPVSEAAAASAHEAAAPSPKTESPKSDVPRREGQPQGQRREPRPPRPEAQAGGPRGDANRERRGPGGGDRGPGGERGPRGPGSERGHDRGERREGRPGGAGGRPFEGFAAEIELEKLISDSLYLDNQAHAVVARMRDLDSGTRSQLRRLYGAVRRAVRTPEAERQHQFVMLRARLAYTIARHSLRSLDALERLLLQVTRRNDARGYERFKDLFEAIIAYNE